MNISDAYRLAKLYVNHCGFSVEPMHFRTKQLLFRGVTFQQQPPTLDHLRKWFGGQARYNVAIIPGAISDNLVILDFDEAGVYPVWLSLVPGAADFPVVRTARGVHVYCRISEPLKNGQGFFEGVHFGQVIAHGSITAPPSVHPSGHVYHWCHSPVGVPYVDTLADLGIVRRNTADEMPARVNPVPVGEAWRPAGKIAHPDAYAQAAIRAECAKLAGMPKDSGRNNQLYVSALKLAKYRSICGDDAIYHALHTAARQCGLDAEEIPATIRSGWHHA